VRPAFIIATGTLSLGLETNGKGFMGFILELPGSFVRGRTEKEVLSKVPAEARSYLEWLESRSKIPETIRVIQRHQCKLTVEDGDCEILLNADQESVAPTDFTKLVELAKYSGQTFSSLYKNSQLREWVDPAKERSTFYGETPKTIEETYNHVNRTQYYYLSRLSRTGIRFPENSELDFVRTRGYCLDQIEKMFAKNGNSQLFEVDNEQWTLKKILRRFIWHDRIHGKAIVRTLRKQKLLGLIGDCQDPFHFHISTS
jgi:hypothetical protein